MIIKNICVQWLSANMRFVVHLKGECIFVIYQCFWSMLEKRLQLFWLF